ncbi:MAG: hypothetical protein JRG69_06915 [Deltaproteobacteria bacterium]|nr:hypothetical protein [Deltaproteobacteria bacterium]
MPVIDPSGFMISVKLVTARGAEFPLWMDGARASDRPGAESIFLDSALVLQDLPIVTAVNIEMQRSYVCTCTVEISATYELGLALLESDLFIIGNVLEVKVGYPRIGLFLPVISTMAVKPSVAINPDDGLTATINGQGGTFAGMRGQTNRQWQNKSVADVLQELANLKQNLWTIDLPERRIPAVAVRIATIAEAGGPVVIAPVDPLYSERGNISQTNKTDWREFTSLCRQVGCFAVVRPVNDEEGPLHVVVRRDSEASSEDPVYTVVARGQIDFMSPNGRFPLLSFETEAEGMWLGAGTNRVTSNDLSPLTGEQDPVDATIEQTSEEITPGTTGTPGPGAGMVGDVNVSVAAEPEDGGDRMIPASAASIERSPEEVVQQGNREESARGGGMSATVSIIGNPLAFPGERIRLENLGVFSGNYEINSMSHAVADGGWTTTMTLLRRGSVDTDHISELLRRAIVPDVSDQPPPDQSGIEEDAQGGGDMVVEPVEGDV